MAVYSTEGGLLIVRNAGARFLFGQVPNFPDLMCRVRAPQQSRCLAPILKRRTDRLGKLTVSRDGRQRCFPTLLLIKRSFLPRKSLIRSI